MKLFGKSLIILAATVLLVVASVDRWNVRANEYFGDGVMLVTTSEQFYGLIAGWGVYAIYGTAQDCRIVPLYSEISDAQTVPCSLKYNRKHNKFSGWMDYRGHPRPFCGAKSSYFPRKCFEE